MANTKNGAHNGGRRVIDSFQLRDNFFVSSKFNQSDGSGMDELIYGVISQRARRPDQNIDSDLTNRYCETGPVHRCFY